MGSNPGRQGIPSIVPSSPTQVSRGKVISVARWAPACRIFFAGLLVFFLAAVASAGAPEAKAPSGKELNRVPNPLRNGAIQFDRRALTLPVELPSAIDSYDLQVLKAPAGGDPLDAWMNERGVVALAYQYFDAGGGHEAAALSIEGKKAGWAELTGSGFVFFLQGQPTASGRVPGSHLLPTGVESGAIYQKNGFVLFPTLAQWPGSHWRISGLNERGWMVGVEWDRTGATPAVGILLENASTQAAPLTAPWAQVTFPQAINNRNVVVGTGFRAGQGYATYSGFLYAGGSFEQIDVPDAQSTYLNGLDARGTLVGSYTTAEGLTRGLILRVGAAWDFTVPASTGTWLDSINERGQICGIFRDANAQNHVFVATPR